MSSNPTINLTNYEEFFLLYLDNELDATQRKRVEAFAAAHPQLGDELQALMATRLVPDATSFIYKEDLLSPAMKLNAVDEDLLLYVDDELKPADKKRIEEKIQTNADVALQHRLLKAAKLDSTEAVLHPNKKELYRHTERVVYMRTWMRVAVAVLILLPGSIYFITKKDGVPNEMAGRQVPKQSDSFVAQKKKPSVTQPVVPMAPQEEQQTVSITASQQKKDVVTVSTSTLKKEMNKVPHNVAAVDPIPSQENRRALKIDAQALQSDLSTTDVAVNKTIIQSPVTTIQSPSYYQQNTASDTPDAVAVGQTTQPSKSKSLLRKVSRFVQRSTGIGTASAGDEVLVGMFTVKLN